MTDRAEPRRERRHHSDAFKMAVVAQAIAPGASVAGIARQHGLNANMVFIWRKDPRFRRQALPGPALLPVEITPDLDILHRPIKVQASGSVANEHIEPPSIEIALPCGVRLTCRGGVDAAALADVLRALKTA